VSPRKAIPVDGLAAATADVVADLLRANDLADKPIKSGKKLADAIGRSQNYVAIRLRKASPFSVSDLADIAKALNVTVAGIVRRAEKKMAGNAAHDA